MYSLCVQFFLSVDLDLAHLAEGEAAAGAAVPRGGYPAVAAGKGGPAGTGKRGRGPDPGLAQGRGPRIDPGAGGILNAEGVDLVVEIVAGGQQVEALTEPTDHVPVPRMTGKPDMMMNHPENQWKMEAENSSLIGNNKGHIYEDFMIKSKYFIFIGGLHNVGLVHKHWEFCLRRK